MKSPPRRTRSAGDFDHAGRAGDVDFGEVVADHVEADQQQAAREQDRRQCFGDFAVARGDSSCATPVPPAARLPRVSPALGMRARQ
jgi:hypothetical protein